MRKVSEGRNLGRMMSRATSRRMVQPCATTFFFRFKPQPPERKEVNARKFVKKNCEKKTGLRSADVKNENAGSLVRNRIRVLRSSDAHFSDWSRPTLCRMQTTTMERVLSDILQMTRQESQGVSKATELTTPDPEQTRALHGDNDRDAKERRQRRCSLLPTYNIVLAVYEVME